jgi:hypothetical protein
VATTYPREQTGWEQVLTLGGTERQQQITRDALDRLGFPWPVLLPGLRARVGRSRIPVVWEDCQAWAAQATQAPVAAEADPAQYDPHASTDDAEHRRLRARATGARAHDDQDHHHDPVADETVTTHTHVSDAEGNVGHPIERVVEGRSRILGLAWYSGEVSLDLSLESDPELAAEVLASEGAHMIDFFWLHYNPTAYVALWNALHPGTAQDVTGPIPEEGHVGHGHGWFDSGGYYTWVGESFMGAVVAAFSDLPLTIEFEHPPTAESTAWLRQAFPLPTLPEPPPQPPPTEPGREVYGVEGSRTYHDSHRGIPREGQSRLTWPSAEQARAAGRQACGVCKPAG